MKMFRNCVIVLLVFLAYCDLINAQKEKVSSKLDFDGSEENENTSILIRPGTKPSSGGGQTSPKIHGVRVSVDTGDTGKKSSKESKESVEINEGRNKKRVGIHTDITFELTGDGDDTNGTHSGQHHEKDNDASVPVFKGRGSTSQRPRRPYDPKSHHWSPNHSSERRPSHHSHNVPVFRGSNDESVYRRIDNWSNYAPVTTTWTTERSFYEPYRPNAVPTGFRNYGNYGQGPSWKPCYCISTTENRRRRDNPVHTTGPVIQVVDSKLDRPFSSK